MNRKIKRCFSLLAATLFLSSTVFSSYAKATALVPALEYTASELLPWLFTIVAGSAGAYALSDEAMQELVDEYVDYAISTAPDLSVELGEVDFSKLAAEQKEEVATKVLTHAKVIKPDWGGNKHNRNIRITEGLVAAVGGFLAMKLIASQKAEDLKDVKSKSFSFTSSNGVKYSFDVVTISDIYALFDSYIHSLPLLSYDTGRYVYKNFKPESFVSSNLGVMRISNKYGSSVPFDKFSIFSLPNDYKTIDAVPLASNYVSLNFLKNIDGGVSILPNPQVSYSDITYNSLHYTIPTRTPYYLTVLYNHVPSFENFDFHYASESLEGQSMKIFITPDVVFTFKAPYTYAFDGAAPLEIPLEDGELEVALPKVEELPDLYEHAQNDPQDRFKKYIGDLLKTMTQSGAQPGVSPGINPGTQPGVNPGTQPGVEPGVNPGTQPGVNPGTQPGTQPSTNFNVDFTGKPDSNYALQGSFKDKFPFCVPFDLIRCVRALKAAESPPRWVYPLSIPSAGFRQDIVLDISTPEWKPVVLVVRSFSVLFFVAGLAVATRNLIRG